MSNLKEMCSKVSENLVFCYCAEVPNNVEVFNSREYCFERQLCTEVPTDEWFRIFLSPRFILNLSLKLGNGGRDRINHPGFLSSLCE